MDRAFMLDKLAGRTIMGRWKRRTYQLVRMLGQGENGVVYLTACDGAHFALKISWDATALSLEWERMREFSHALVAPCPKVYELDDAELDGQCAHFFVMEYVEGKNLRQYVSHQGVEAVPDLLLQLANLLHSLHERGFVYGDLKPENVLMHKATGKPILIDFGGVTPLGTVVKEFTEIYDRAFWGWGMRKADEHYDLFSLAMMGAFLYQPMNSRTREKLIQSSPDVRKTALSRYFQQLHERSGVGRALYFTVCGKIQRVEEFSEALKNQRQQVAFTKSKGTVSWDVTDWGLLFSILVFTFAIISILFLGGHQSLFVIQ